MKVVRNFDKVYEAEEDPWAIGNADSARYRRYLDLLLPLATGRILDIGCGMGAFLAHFRGSATKLVGVELSALAIERGLRRFPFIEFHQGSAAAMQGLPSVDQEMFDLIILSDVVYYLSDAKKDQLMFWVARHVAPGGKVFVAGYCPGSRYPLTAELRMLVDRHFKIVKAETLDDSQHLALIATPRRRFAALTIDYETWHPIPAGKAIDWQKDIFAPAEALMDMYDRAGIVGSFFIEMGEYFWLRENQPDIADRMEEQWREIVRRGHDAQLHLHPCWMPETGAAYKWGEWTWDWSKAKAADYPGDLTALIARCKAVLETAIRPVKPDYAVTCFRAGAYQAQPFGALSAALLANGIWSDSSVYAGGVSTDRGYDYSHAYSTHQPYFADLLDPQLRAVPAEERIVELPIFTPRSGMRWMTDNARGLQFAEALQEYERRRRRRYSIAGIRIAKRLRQVVTTCYAMMPRRARAFVNKIMPRRFAYTFIANSRPPKLGDICYVSIGHTKADINHVDLESSIASLKASAIEFVTISDMADHARADLESARRRDEATEMDFQITREAPIQLTGQYNHAQAKHLQNKIPLDCSTVLDVGCGAGQWSLEIARRYPWMEVTGVDASVQLVEHARKIHGHPRVKFGTGNFAELPFSDESFDCAYADNSLEHCFDIDKTLAEISRILKPAGSLLAALPPDALNPDEECDSHSWKTIEAQVVLRFFNAGFTSIETEELDTFRQLGQSPYMPSNDRMIYVRARKGRMTRLERAIRAMHWVYNRIEPSQPNLAVDPVQILADGHGWCIAYTLALGGLLAREGYDVTWVTMRAHDHERGAGKWRRDHHEVIEVIIDGKAHLFDPMANTHYPHSLQQLLKRPKLADACFAADERGLGRHYDLYAASYWYDRVVSYSRRRNTRFPSLFWKKVIR